MNQRKLGQNDFEIRNNSMTGKTSAWRNSCYLTNSNTLIQITRPKIKKAGYPASSTGAPLQGLILYYLSATVLVGNESIGLPLVGYSATAAYISPELFAY